MRRGRLGAYAPWQLGDFALRNAVLIALALGFILWSQVAVTRAAMGPGWADGPMGEQRSQTIFDGLLGMLGWLGGILAVRGIVAADRRQGFFRFYFAKPIGLVRFYLQSWAASGVGLAVLAAILAVVHGVVARPVPIAGAVAATLLTWIAVGGLGFLLSTLTDIDGLMLALLSVAGLAATEYARARRIALEEPLPWLEAARYLLPPVEPLRDTRDALLTGMPLDPSTIAWIVGFGSLCLAAGTFVLRRRPFGA